MNPATRRRIVQVLDDLNVRDQARLARAAESLFKSGQLRNELRAAREMTDPTKLPDPWLLYLTQGTVSGLDYHEGGRASADYIRQRLADSGMTLTPDTTVLDFGCGAGRILRWWKDLHAQGCDYNPQFVPWCVANLTGVPITRNGAAPPTRYPSNTFDVVYAQSVLTHLTPCHQGRWMREWARVVRPGGLILATFLGPSHLGSDREITELHRTGHLMRSEKRAGSNLCAV